MTEAAREFPIAPVQADLQEATPKVETWSKHRRLLYKRVKVDGVTIAQLAKDMDVSRPYLSRFISENDFKPSDNLLETIEEYFKRTNYWYTEGQEDLFKRPEGFINDIKDMPFILSECLRRIVYVLQSTWERKNFGMITGPSGCGKSAAVKYWLNDHIDHQQSSIFITANGTMTRKAILRRIAKELGMFAPADADALIERICNELRAEPRLIIIDEADQISNEYKLETLRSIVDNCDGSAGIVLIGNEDLSENIMRMAVDKRKLSRIHNRFGANQKVKMPTDAEANQLLEQVNLTPHARHMLVSIMQRTNGMGGYRVCQSILKTLFAAIGNEQITEEHLRSESLRTAVLSLNA